MEPSVYANIMIPMEVKKREGCQFSMILFSYIPSENWLNYVDEDYRMKFFMEIGVKFIKYSERRAQSQRKMKRRALPSCILYSPNVLKLSGMANYFYICECMWQCYCCIFGCDKIFFP